MSRLILSFFVDHYYKLRHYRSSRPKVFCKKGVLKNFPKFTGKHLCQNLFFNKVAGLRPASLLKKRLWHWCFPVKFLKFLKKSFLQNTSGRLLSIHDSVRKKTRIKKLKFKPYLGIQYLGKISCTWTEELDNSLD